MNTKKMQTHVTADILAVVGAQVRRLRCEAAMSQQELADHCDIFRTYLSRIENCAANPTVTVMAALASALKVPIAVFFQE